MRLELEINVRHDTHTPDSSVLHGPAKPWEPGANLILSKCQENV